MDVVTAGIAEVRERSIVTADGTEHEVDTIIFGTGFHVTDIPVADRIAGRGRSAAQDRWADGMQAYQGTAVAGFPNLFLLVGPNTGLGHSSQVFMIESQIAYVVDALRHVERTGEVVEVRAEAEAAWDAGVQRGHGPHGVDHAAAAPAGTSTTGVATPPSGPAPPGASAGRPPASIPTPTASSSPRPRRRQSVP